MIPIPVAKPTATVTVEPMGPRSSEPREHSIKVALRLGTGESKHADTGYAGRVARTSLAAFPPALGEPDQRRVIEVSAARKAGKGGAVVSVVIGVEGSVTWSGRPKDDSVEDLCAALLGEGYRVAVREKRECGEAGCKSDALVDWTRASDVPPGWYSDHICGRHNYRTCTKCKSVYVLTSANFVGQAPSVHCEVCGLVLIEWGSSKLWNAELMKRGKVAKPAGA